MPKTSPQIRWARKKKRQGRCSRCGARRNMYKQLCDYHQGLFTEYMREWRNRKIKKETNDGNQGQHEEGSQGSL